MKTLINNKIEFSKVEKYSLLSIWILFTSTSPFEFFAIIPYHPYKLVPLIFIIIYSIYLIKNKLKIKIDSIIIILIIQIVYSAIAPIIHSFSLENFIVYDGEIYLRLILHLIVILITYFFVKQTISFKKLSYSYVLVMTLMAFLGFITVVAVVLFDIQPISYTNIPNHRDISNFIFSFSTGYYESDGAINIIRSSGYFDEPGTFAFYLIVALILNKIYGFSTFLEKCLIFFGFSTLSLAFIISLFFYYFLFGIFERKFKRIIWMFIISSIFFLVIDNTKDDYPLVKSLYNLTIYRMTVDNTGSGKLIAGDNRSDYLFHSIKAFKSAPLFGYGMHAHTKDKHGFKGKLCCNPFHPLASEGIVGTMIYFSLFILWLYIIFNKKNIDWISFAAWCLILINFLQRPGFSNGPFGYFVFIMLFQATQSRNK